ncbi:MAG: hypothetical protein ACNS62_15025 [Candidatus Cyclobacteriaceae bacterium M3_2C_046]
MDICKSRHRGYTMAAEFTKDNALEKLFVKYAKQSDDFEYELMHFLEKETIYDIGKGAAEDPAFKGWHKFNEDLEELSDINILKICEKEEKATIGDYEEVLGEDLPMDVTQVLNQQLIEITTAFDNLRRLQASKLAK